VHGPDTLVHPKNRKVKCRVHLRDLQSETGLTDAALHHIALVCGPRQARPHASSSMHTISVHLSCKKPYWRAFGPS
jgi:hypothetical protein